MSMHNISLFGCDFFGFLKTYKKATPLAQDGLSIYSIRLMNPGFIVLRNQQNNRVCHRLHVLPGREHLSQSRGSAR